MTIFARSPFTAALTGSARRLIFAIVLSATLMGAYLLTAAPAGALVSTVGSTTVGLQPRNGVDFIDGELGAKFDNAGGNPVLHSAKTYVIYWDPTDNYHGDWQHVIDGYFANVGAADNAGVFAVDTQYTDKTNKPASLGSGFMGAYTFTEPYPTSGGCSDPSPPEAEDRIGHEVAGKHTAVCLTNAQVVTAIEKFIATYKTPKGMGADYYLLTPPSVAVCLDGGGESGHCSDFKGEKAGEALSAESEANSFCSYHGDVNPGGLSTGDGNTILYAVVPWTAGGLGDPHLGPKDRTAGYECQDGGFDPSSKPAAEAREKAKEKSPKEQKEFEEKSPQEQKEQEDDEKLQGPHEEQPNQVICPTSDGGCDRGLADAIVTQVASEQQNMVTNPLLNAWQDPAKLESTDECRNFFAPVDGGNVTALLGSDAGTLYNQEFGGGDYYLNYAFNLAAFRLPYPGVPCQGGINLEPLFTAPNPVNAGEMVDFDGMESDITLDAAVGFSESGTPQANYATFTWNFGDGSPVLTGFAPGAPVCETPWLPQCAASMFHSYTYGGTYTVTLTVKDVGGHTASVSEQVKVDGPSPPAPAASAAGGAGAGAGAGAPGSTPGGASGPIPAPVALASIVSRQLRPALRTGLVVRYSVNEQVAGRFEVLLSRSIARRLKISGSPAVGLPAGSPAELVVAKAILVTTKGGRSTVKILFSKKTASRLHGVHKVSLMLRLIVRNASRSPLTTTAVSSATLTG